MPAIQRNHILCIITLILVSILSITPAFALSLEEAKSNGLVGEQTNGYLGTVPPNPPHEVISLVNDINQKRQQAYKEIAEKNKTDLQKVEILAAEKAINRTSPGNYIQVNGQWVKK